MRLKHVLGLACGLALTTSVHAQTPPPAAPAQGQAQIQPGQAQPAQTNPYPTQLYRMNDVSKSLNLTQDQVNGLNKLTEQTQAQYRANYEKLNTLSPAERQVQVQQLNQQYTADWNKGASTVFNNDQRGRYQQFNYQHGGFNALYDPDVQKRLSLTPGQMKNLDEHRDWSNQQLQDINRLGATDPTKGTQMYNDYWKQRQERFNKYLTPEQQKAWLEMTGEPYTFQPGFGPSR